MQIAGIFEHFYTVLFFRHLKLQKIQGTYFKTQGTYFKIYGLYFLQHALCFFHIAKSYKKSRLLL